ncbi:hypothetical protein HAZT_HAZT011655 [Hyalella azteca]|uniref:Uncharacterized protein n=1 Tax=Hyalella azteca TaxID=294128 RepID=A0A6A0HCL5_HYAAZ|nr:hypothetical protein HAZT_HAZT011655 [Hyalella azteca]
MGARGRSSGEPLLPPALLPLLLEEDDEEELLDTLLLLLRDLPTAWGLARAPLAFLRPASNPILLGGKFETLGSRGLEGFFFVLRRRELRGSESLDPETERESDRDRDRDGDSEYLRLRRDLERGGDIDRDLELPLVETERDLERDGDLELETERELWRLPGRRIIRPKASTLREPKFTLYQNQN